MGFFQTKITEAQDQEASFPLECISMNMCDPPTLKAIFVCGLRIGIRSCLFSVFISAVSVN